MYQASARNSVAWDNNGTIRSDWNFDTIKSSAAMGSFRNIAKDLGMPPGMEADGDEYPDEDGSFEGQGSIDTSAATQGSDPLTKSTSAIGINQRAAHSTVVIRPPQSPTEEKDVPALLDAGEISSPAETSDLATHDDAVPLCAPPAYSGSVRMKRASYKARNAVHGPGTVLSQADLGTGVDTIRPVKKVDTVGSIRLSEGFVGNARRESGASPPVSPTKESLKRRATESATAGKSMVDEVILPLLQNAIRDDMDAREIESLSMLSRGFNELKEANPELAYNVILDILSGINDNTSVRNHVQTSRNLFPHKRITRRSEMTAKGLVVTEVQEDVSGLPSTSGHSPDRPAKPCHSPSLSTSSKGDDPVRKSPIAELLYMRWLEGLKIKWPML
jgi:serine/threonine-protein kinase 24/25/MST4